MKTLLLRFTFPIALLILFAGQLSAQTSDCAQQDYGCKIDAASKRVAANTNDSEAFYDRAYAYYQQGNYDLSVDDYTRYISMKPDKIEYLADGYAGRGDAYRKKGNSTLAFADYNRAISISPGSATGYIGRGNAYVEQSNYDAALKDFNKSVQLTPDNAETYYGRGRVYEKLKNWDMAIADFDRYISTKTGNDQYLSDGFYLRAYCYFSKSNYTQAVNDYSKAITLHPTAAMYKERAAAYRKLGKITLAAADEREAAQLDKQ
jgi:Tetratricopeptide repeat.